MKPLSRLVGEVGEAIPAVRWLRTYRHEYLWGDLSAGLTLAVMLVPQGMAYALLAGLPPVVGLYAASVPLAIYALFGSSHHLACGPVAIVSLLTYTALSRFAEPESGEYIGLALLLALMAGAVQLALGLVRAGFIANFLSHPVISGFTSAAAIVIGISQLNHLLGISLASEGSIPGMLFEASGRLQEVEPRTLAIGLGSIAALVILRKLLPRAPAPLLVVVGTTLLVYLFTLHERGVEIVGEVPQGLPGFSLPPLDLQLVGALFTAALAIALVGFVESIAVAKAISIREGYEVDPSLELKSLGLANLSAAFFSGYPVAGSFSRTAVNYESGGRTQLSSAVTALLIVLTLLFFTPLFYYLPEAVLAAIVMVAVYGLINLREAARLYRINKSDGLALLITFGATLVIGVEQGLAIGVVFALLAFVHRSARPRVTELGYVQEKDAFLDVRRYPEAKTFPEVLIVRFEASLYFANVHFFKDHLISEAAGRPELRWIILNCRGVNSVDTTALEELESLLSGFRERGVEVLFSGIKLPVRERMREAGWQQRFAENIRFATNREALQAAGILYGSRETKGRMP